MSLFLAAALKPLILLLLAALVLIPARLAVQRFMPDGKLKQFLLR